MTGKTLKTAVVKDSFYKIKTSSKNDEYRPSRHTLANMQLKNSRSFLDFLYVPFRIIKRPVLHCSTTCFGLQNGLWRKARRPVS